MEGIGEILADIINRNSIPAEPCLGDFADGGITYCGVCGEPKTALIDWFPDADGTPQKKIVPIGCRCKREEIEKENERAKKEEFNRYISNLYSQYSVPERNISGCVFAKDNGMNPSVFKVCKLYVEQWEEFLKDDMGIIFYGLPGTGKSFYAACIVNALLEKGVPAAMTTTARILNTMQGNMEKQAIIDHLQNYKLLALDDLGAERNTSYGSEIVYSVIDARCRQGLPLIVTTNIDLENMKRERNIDRMRIYERVIEMCQITLKMEGSSFRREMAEAKRAKAREMMKRVWKQNNR